MCSASVTDMVYPGVDQQLLRLGYGLFGGAVRAIAATNSSASLPRPSMRIPLAASSRAGGRGIFYLRVVEKSAGNAEFGDGGGRALVESAL